MDNNEFEGESRAGSPHKASSKLARKHLIDKGSSDSEEEEEVTISFAEAIQEVVSLLPPEFCPRKERHFRGLDPLWMHLTRLRIRAQLLFLSPY